MSHHRASALFNEERVRAAVATASTQSEALRLLGIQPHGANRRRLLAACLRYRLTPPGSLHALEWTFEAFSDDARVLAALRGGGGYSDVCERLGVTFAHYVPDFVRGACDRLGQPYPRARAAGCASANTLKATSEVAEAILLSTSLSAACATLGVPANTETRARLREIASQLGLPAPQDARSPGGREDVRVRRREVEALGREALAEVLSSRRSATALLAHLGMTDTSDARAWLHGVVRDRGLPPLVANVRSWSVPTEAMFTLGSGYTTQQLRARIVAEDLIEHDRCVECRQSQSWRGKTLVLELDHVNGVTSDCRLENLRFLCPNCHSQTPTFRGRTEKVNAA